jgi:hypothetical protein
MPPDEAMTLAMSSYGKIGQYPMPQELASKFNDKKVYSYKITQRFLHRPNNPPCLCQRTNCLGHCFVTKKASMYRTDCDPVVSDNLTKDIFERESQLMFSSAHKTVYVP